MLENHSDSAKIDQGWEDVPLRKLEIDLVQMHGYSKKAVDPDSVIVRVLLENKARSPRVAEDLHKNIRGDTQKALADPGISESDLQVSGPYMGAESSVVSGSTITSQYLNGISSLLQAVSAKPGMTVEAFTYGHTRQAELVEKVRTRALLDAKAKALSMTRVLGVGLGQAVFIQEIDSSITADRTGREIPDIRIKTKVEVVFRLEGGSDGREKNN